MMTEYPGVKGKFLVAMPMMLDPIFEQTVIYVVEHDENGALGFIINKPTTATVEDIMQGSHDDTVSEDVKDHPLLFGGPVEPNKTAVIMPEEIEEEVYERAEEQGADNSETFSEFLHRPDEFANSMIFVGRSEWQPGQLEAELKDNAWHVLEFDGDLVSDRVPYEDRYFKAAAKMGIDLTHMHFEPGNA